MQEKLTPLSRQEGIEFNKFSYGYLDDNDDGKQHIAGDKARALYAAYHGSFDDLLLAIEDNIREKHDLPPKTYLRRNQKIGDSSIPDKTQQLGTADVKTVGKTAPLRTSDMMPITNPNIPRKITPSVKPQKSDVLEQEVKTELANVTALLKKFNVDKMITELRQLGIGFSDFHAGNVMKRGSQYVINDIGRSRSKGGEPPVLEKMVVSALEEIGGGFAPMGQSMTGVNAGSSDWSSGDRRMTDDDEPGEIQWQNKLTRVLPPPNRGTPDVK